MHYLDGLHQLAKDNPDLALILFDVKPSVAAMPDGPANGKKILDEIRSRLNTDGVNLNIIINVGSRDDIHLFDDILSTLGEREGVQVDGEDRADLIVGALKQAAHGNIGYGDGTIAQGPNLPRAIDLGFVPQGQLGRSESDIRRVHDPVRIVDELLHRRRRGRNHPRRLSTRWVPSSPIRTTSIS